MRSSSVYDGQCIHNGEQYSKRRRTNEQYTIYLVRVEEFHPNVRLTTHVRGFFFIILSMCLTQESELVMAIPKSHTMFTLYKCTLSIA